MIRSAKPSYLLDTHVVVWMDSGSSRISSHVSEKLNASRALYFSTASAWEIAIKRASGKMGVRAPLSEAAVRLELIELAASVAHGEAAGALPMHHDDPFDRLLIAQAQLEGMILVTADKFLQQYDVEVLLVEASTLPAKR